MNYKRFIRFKIFCRGSFSGFKHLWVIESHAGGIRIVGIATGWTECLSRMHLLRASSIDCVISP